MGFKAREGLYVFYVYWLQTALRKDWLFLLETEEFCFFGAGKQCGQVCSNAEQGGFWPEVRS